ncbi:MAG: hypothetical protein AB4911_16780 [Oscillochloridaceae bacterium umkhey_bin13]
MGRGDEHELVPTDPELSADEATIRMILRQSGEPALVEPPPGLANRVLTTLADGRPTRAPRRLHPWWLPALGGFASLTLLLLVLGGLVLTTTSNVAGSPGSGMTLALGQLAQPVLPLLPLLGGVSLLILLGLLVAFLLWQRRRRAP